MGRLGFNLVRQKEANKNVESGVADQQQNESNESVEIGELINAIDRANRTIKNYRWLSTTLIAVIITLCGYIFLTQARFHSTQAVLNTLNKIQEEYSNRMEAVQGDYNAQTAKLERSQSLVLEDMHNAERKKFLHELEAEKTLRIQENVEANAEYNILQESFNALKAKHDELSAQCQKKEESLQKEIKDLQSGREELLAKIETSNRKLELQRSESQVTTTPRPRFFGSTQLKKINDLMKDIESVGRLVGNVFRDGI